MFEPVSRRSLSTRVVVLAVSCVLALAASVGCGSTVPPKIDLTILSINDFHGALESEMTDRATNRPIGGAPYVAAVIDRERATNRDGTIVLDGGDVFQGTALSNLTMGRATIEFMNTLELDAAAIGNHEFDWGVPVLVERIEQATYPMLCANIVVRETGELPEWAEPYVIVQRQGLRIAIIGLITPSTPRVTLPQNVAAYDFPDPAAVANRWIEALVPKQADVAVLVCHIGGFQRGADLSGHVVTLAEQVQGEVVVVGGHTHRTVAGLVDGTAVIEAGSNGRYVARADLTIDTATRTVDTVETRLVQVFQDDIEPDPEVAAIVARHREEVAPILDEVIGQAAVDLSVARNECPMGNLVADIMREASGASFAFQNPGGIRSSIEAGGIRFSDVYRVMPFDNTIVTVELDGAEVRQLLEESVGDGSFLHVAGLSYDIDYDLEPGSRIRAVELLGGGTLDPKMLYPVAINNFMAQGGDNLSVVTDHEGAVDTGVLVRGAIADYIRQITQDGQAVTARVEGRIRGRH